MSSRILDISLYHLVKSNGHYYATGRVFSPTSQTFEITKRQYYLARLTQWLGI